MQNTVLLLYKKRKFKWLGHPLLPELYFSVVST